MAGQSLWRNRPVCCCLDEPTSWLDIAHQLTLLIEVVVRPLNKDKGTTVVWVLHDLNQAAEYSDQLYSRPAMKEGQLVCHGGC